MPTLNATKGGDKSAQRQSQGNALSHNNKNEKEKKSWQERKW